MNEINELLTNYSKEVKKAIDDSLSTIIPNNLQEASIYLTNAGGKMIRPAITLIVSEALGSDKEGSLNAAASIELIHTFSLIHDDIMDDDDVRRGVPAVHKVWGDDVAILSGDTLFSKAFELIINSDKSPTQNNNALATVADACVQICEGQALDISFEGRFDVSEEEYMTMVFKKTGALIAAASKVGAIMGGANDEVSNIMYEYGKLIGIAFQIQDDYLDVVGDEKDIGKPVGSDIAKGKMTLMVVKALSEADEEDSKTLLKILKSDDSSNDDIDLAISIFEKYGSIQYAHDVALGNVNKAKELLKILPDNEAKKVLALIADFVLERHS